MLLLNSIDQAFPHVSFHTSGDDFSGGRCLIFVPSISQVEAEPNSSLEETLKGIATPSMAKHAGKLKKVRQTFAADGELQGWAVVRVVNS